MYQIISLIYFLSTLISNVNSLSIIKTNLTHLDKLYFKHNKRHKLFVSNGELFTFINPNNSIYLPKFSKINDFNSIKSNSFNYKIYDRNTISNYSLFMDGNDSKDSASSTKRSGSNDLKSFQNNTNNVSEKQTPRNVKKSKDSSSQETDKWLFRGKDNIGDKLSEYETLMSEIKDLSKSKDKSDKDLYSFIKKNLKGTSVDPDMKLTTHHIMDALDRQSFNEDLKTMKWLKYMNRLRTKIFKKFQSSDKIPYIPNPIDIVMEAKAKEDSCGFRYPIQGSPEEIYTDPESYKFWGRTPLSQIHSTHPNRETSGKIEEKDNDQKLEDLIISTSPKYEKRLEEALKSMRESKFESRMKRLIELERDKQLDTDREGTLERGKDKQQMKNKIREELRQDKLDEEGERYRNIEFENYYESFKKDFLESKPERQDLVLNILNKYNPWDEYIKMRNLKSSLPTIGINYKLNIKNLNINFTSNEKIQENIIREFLREYLHYFLFLESDSILFKEFKNSKFLYDVLKYFDLNEKIEIEEKKEYMDLTDKFFKLYFPEHCQEGFPKRPPDAEFPLTLNMNKGLMGLSDKLTGRKNSYHRVNMVCSLMALAKCYTFVKQYTNDIFTEKRFKMILDTLETGLSLELQRMELGISEIEVNNLNYRTLCEIDGIFLSVLTKVLAQWNIRRGVENILDLVLLLTLTKLNEINGTDLVTIIQNVTHLTTLPRSVYSNFLSKIIEFVQQKMKFSIVNGVDYMNLEESLNLLSVIVSYPKLVTKPFMETFIKAYRDPIIDLGKELDEYKYQLIKLDMERDREKDRERDEKLDREKERSKHRQKEIEQQRENILDKIEMIRYQVFPLISCLQLAGLKEYMYLVHQLTKGLNTDDLNLNTSAAISVLENFNESDEFQRKIINRAKNNLIRDKYLVDKGRVLESLRIYVEGVKNKRIYPDPYFYCTMIKQFCFLRNPDPDQLVEAAILTDEFSPNLNQNQLYVIFRDLARTPLYFNFLTRIGLRGEFLNYPLSTVAQILYYSSKNNVVIEKNWKTFYEMVELFKHILSIDDVILILDALLVSNFTGADQLLDILCKRVCNIIEISEIRPEKVLEIMEKCLKLDYVPIQLLRYYTYSNLFEIQNSDHVRNLVDGQPEYDIDFRGWKRPVTYEEHTEPVRLNYNVLPEVRMRGSRPLVDENLRYSVQPSLKEPSTFKDIEKQNVNYDILVSLNKFVNKVKESNYKFSESDLKLIKSLMDIVQYERL